MNKNVYMNNKDYKILHKYNSRRDEYNENNYYSWGWGDQMSDSKLRKEIFKYINRIKHYQWIKSLNRDDLELMYSDILSGILSTNILFNKYPGNIIENRKNKIKKLLL